MEKHIPKFRPYLMGLESLKEFIEKLEQFWICEALFHCEGNCTEAAKLLGMKRVTLVSKRKRYGFGMRKAK